MCKETNEANIMNLGGRTMNLLNEKVKHNAFGAGVITEANGNKISVKFGEDSGTKTFIYPDAFEKFLKAENPVIEETILKELSKKQEQINQELERIKKEREAAEQEQKKAKLEPVKKKTVARSRKK
jgi:hypothetical protein